MNPGIKSTELYVAIAGMAAAVIPVILDKVPAESAWAVLLAAVLAAATYIAGRSHLKATDIKANAVIKANESRAQVAQANPTQPG